jgi:hypothetical protein
VHEHVLGETAVDPVTPTNNRVVTVVVFAIGAIPAGSARPWGDDRYGIALLESGDALA